MAPAHRRERGAQSPAIRALLLLLLDESGQVVEESARLARNVLVWESGGVTYRLEGDFGKEKALRLRATAAHPPGDAAPSPEGAALGRERREALLEAVSGLDERDRDVLTCRYFLELSEEETAQVLGVRRGTVKSRTARALARLREVVAGD